MFRITKDYGETPEEQRLVSGDALLTVTNVEGDSITGWFYTDWWDTETVVSLLRGTPCEYADWTDEQLLDAQDERYDFTNPLRCKCAACLIGDGLTYERTHGECGETELVTVKVPYWWEPTSEGDRLMVSGIFMTSEVYGSDDRHGISDYTLSPTTYCGSVRWREWEGLHLNPWTAKTALYYLADHANA